MKQDKQPRRAGKNVSLDKLHPPSDMNASASGGDKESHEPLPRRLKSGEQPHNGPVRGKR
jgi:hypothetical protein